MLCYLKEALRFTHTIQIQINKMVKKGSGHDLELSNVIEGDGFLYEKCSSPHNYNEYK